MPLPSVTVSIGEESYIATTGESVGSFVAGALVHGMTLINALGTSLDVENKFMAVDLQGLWSRLNSRDGNGAGYSFDGFGGSAGVPALYPGILEGGTGNTADQVRWPVGPTGDWKTMFWTAEECAKYGARLIIGVSSADPFTSGATAMHAVFDLDGQSDGLLSGVLNNRDNTLIVVRSETDKAGTTDTNNKYNVFVFGTKEIYQSGESTTNRITVPLTADFVGTMARSTKISPWVSNAGFRRGYLLTDNLHKLSSPLSASEASTLYNNNIIPILSFQNQGLVVFGDKTASGEKIGSIRLLIYLTEEIGKIARNQLFEINNELTRSSFVNQSIALLESLKSQDAIIEYAVVCDETNNTTNDIANGIFTAEVTYRPIDSIGEIKLSFTNRNQQDIL